MPKKTKKQKLLAQLHRQQSTSGVSYNYNASKQLTPKDNNPKLEIVEKYSTVYLASDLRKTLILTTLAILFELVLYWLWR